MSKQSRGVLVALVATIVTASALAAGASYALRHHDARATDLETTATVGATGIRAAIEQGAAAEMATFLPGSEASTVANAVKAGLLDAVPADAALPAGGLDAVKAIASGAVAVSDDVAREVDLTASEIDALRGSARGWMGGALPELPEGTSFQVTALATTLTGAYVAGAAEALGAEGAFSDAADHAAAAEEASAVVTAWIADEGVLLSNVVGAPALAEVATYGADLVSRSLARFPHEPTQDQLRVLGAWTGGELAGMADGVLTHFTGGVPPHLEAVLDAWFAALASAPLGTVPTLPGSAELEPIATWAFTLSTGMPERVLGVDYAPSVTALDYLYAWGLGLAFGAFDHAGALAAVGEDGNAAVQAYAGGAIANTEAYLARFDGASPTGASALEAYAGNLTAGLDDLEAAAGASAGLVHGWVAGVAAAALGVPTDIAPEKAAVLAAFAAGATEGAIGRLPSIQEYAGGVPAQSLANATLEGFQTGMDDFLRGSGDDTDPNLVHAFVNGLSTGFLDSGDPGLLFGDAGSTYDAWTLWVGNALAASPFELTEDAYDGLQDAPGAVYAFALAVASPAHAWAGAKASGGVDEAYAVVGPFSSFLVAEGLRALQDPADYVGEVGVPSEQDIKEYQAEVRAYAERVVGEVPSPGELAELADLVPAVETFLGVALEPLGWLDEHDAFEEAEAANAFLGVTIEHGKDVTKLADVDYAERVLAVATAIGSAVTNVTGAAPHAEAQAKVLAAWVTGLQEAVLGAPTGPLASKADEYAAWAKGSTEAAADATVDASKYTLWATTDYANRTLALLIETAERLPEQGAPPLPLKDWFNATVTRTLESFPGDVGPLDPMVYYDAYVAYASGVAAAITAVPQPGTDGLTDEQAEALLAYVGAVSEAGDTVVEDVDYFITCACPPLSERIHEYGERVQVWAHGVVAGAAEAMPDTTPTSDGVDALRLYAESILGENSPRGPADEFGGATLRDAEAFGRAAAAGVPIVAGLTGDAEAILDEAERSLRAVHDATRDHYNLEGLGADDLQLPTPGEPTPPETGLPLPPLTPEEIVGLLDDQAFLQSVIGAVFASPPGELPDVFPDDLPTTEPGQHEYDFLHSVVTEGLAATSRIKEYPLDRAAALYAFSGGLVAAGRESVGNASGNALLFHEYAGGVANAGVTAVLTAKDGVVAEQVPILVAYAGALATYDPSWVPPPPTPEGGSPPPVEAWVAHGLALGAAVLDLPTDPLEARADEWLARVGPYLDAVLHAAEQYPPLPVTAEPDAVATWVHAEVEGILGNPPDLGADDLIAHPDPVVGVEYLRALTTESVAALADAIGDEDALWAHAAAEAARLLECPTGLDVTSCALVGDILGQGTGLGLADALFGDDDEPHQPDPDPNPNPDPDPPRPPPQPEDDPWLALPTPTVPTDEQQEHVDAAVAGAAAAVLALAEDDSLSPSAAVAAVRGAVAGIVPPPTPALGAPGAPTAPAAPDAAAIMEAVVLAAHDAADDLDASQVRALAESLASLLPTAEPGLDAVALQEIADGVASLVTERVLAGLAPDDDAIRAVVAQFFAGSTRDPTDDPTVPTAPAVSVTSGTRQIRERDLGGGAWLSGLNEHVIRVSPPADLGRGTWDVLWTTGTSPDAGGRQIRLAESGGVYSGTITASELAAVPDGATIRFVVIHTGAGDSSERFDRDGAPYAYRVDRVAPTATVTAPTTSDARTFRVAWSGDDGAGAGVATYHVRVRVDGGEWRDHFRETAATALQWTGEDGRTYEFSVRATDRLKHAGEGDSVVTTRVVLPEDAPDENTAPTVRFLAPAEGAAHAAAFLAEWATEDDGGATSVVVTLRRAGSAKDLRTVYEGTGTSVLVAPSSIADGVYHLHAVATDGTLTAEADSPDFRIDLTPPGVRAVIPRVDRDRVVLVVARLASAESALAEVVPASGGAPVIATVTLQDSGTNGDERAGDGTWTATVRGLPVGEYRLVVRARDDLGNEATRSVPLSLKAAVAVVTDPAPGGSSTLPPTTPDPAPGGGSTTPTPPTPPRGTATPTAPSGEPPAEEERRSFLPAPGAALSLLAAGAALALAGRLRARGGRR